MNKGDLWLTRFPSILESDRQPKPRRPVSLDDDIPDFGRMGEDAEAFANRVLAEYDGDRSGYAFDDIEASVELIYGGLKRSVRIARAPGMLMQRVDSMYRNLEEIIEDLHGHGIVDTAPLDAIKAELHDWLAQRGRGKGPQPAPMP